MVLKNFIGQQWRNRHREWIYGHVERGGECEMYGKRLSHVKLFVTPWTVAHQLPCPSPTPSVYSNSCPSSWWCHPTISFSVVPFSYCLRSSPASGSFSNESVLPIRSPKYWSFSFSISPSNEYSGLVSLRIDWLDLFAVQGTLESYPTPPFKSISSSVLRFLYGPILTSIHDYWKNYSFD